MGSRLVKYGLILMSLFGVWHLGLAGKFYAKAWLAEQLIESAWQRTLEGETKVRPWPWADTWPVAELTLPRLGIRQLILSGDSGRVLAFGAGLTESSAQLGKSGLSIVSGHRDTNFKFLRDINIGDLIKVKVPRGEFEYQVQDFAVVDQRDFLVDPESYADADNSSLLLVSCYPFDALKAGGDLRFVALAKSLKATKTL
tara:strand:- start:1124 stop:1720 length:597 start_codon:yes stop_codon:yes gene_type:complete